MQSMVRKKLLVRAKGGCLCGDKGGGGSVIGFLVKYMQTGTAQCQSRWERKRRKACACEPSTWKKGESLNNKWSRRSARWFCNNKEDDHFSVRSVLELGLTIEDGSPFSRLSQSIAFDAFGNTTHCCLWFDVVVDFLSSFIRGHLLPIGASWSPQKKRL